jgi:hypothetical protein
MKKGSIVEIISYLFIFLFLYTGISKLIDIKHFVSQIKQSPLIEPWSTWIAIIIPSVEIFISIMLLFPRWRIAGLYGCLALMVMFATYIIAILQFGNQVPCSCGGIISRMSWQTHRIFNIVFVFLAIIAIILESRNNLIRQVG